MGSSVNARLVVTDEASRVVGVAMFGEDGTAVRADLSPPRALAVARRMIEAAERKLLEAADDGRVPAL
ncbi:MAG: hypothetical protein WCO00_08845 [Rhodospirillaceae bacterium]